MTATSASSATTTAPMDLRPLREITDGNPAIEQELFTLFLQTSDRCLLAMRQAQATRNRDAWRNTAHEWKGAAANVGAFTLSRLCRDAEQQPDAEQWSAVVDALAEEYQRVQAFLKNLPAS